MITKLIQDHHQEDKVYTLYSDDADLSESGIEEIQKHLSQADMVYMTYPIEWGSYPYSYKETIDKLLTYGYAYEMGEQGTKGLLNKKKAKIITTTGHPNEYYQEQLKSIHYLNRNTVLEFVGIEVTGALNIGGRHHGKTEGFPADEVTAFLKG